MKPVNKTIELATLSSIAGISVLAGLAYFKIHDTAQTIVARQLAHAGAQQTTGNARRTLPGKPGWTGLSIAQQKALLPLLSQWDKLDAIDQAKWLKIANRYMKLNPNEQKRMQKRMESWAKFSPEQKQTARLNYAQTRKIEVAKKSQQWELYQQLPATQKQLLASGLPFQLTQIQSPKTLVEIGSSATAEIATTDTTQGQSSSAASLASDTTNSTANHSGVPAVAK